MFSQRFLYQEQIPHAIPSKVNFEKLRYIETWKAPELQPSKLDSSLTSKAATAHYNRSQRIGQEDIHKEDSSPKPKFATAYLIYNIMYRWLRNLWGRMARNSTDYNRSEQQAKRVPDSYFDDVKIFKDRILHIRWTLSWGSGPCPLLQKKMLRYQAPSAHAGTPTTAAEKMRTKYMGHNARRSPYVYYLLACQQKDWLSCPWCDKPGHNDITLIYILDLNYHRDLWDPQRLWKPLFVRIVLSFRVQEGPRSSLGCLQSKVIDVSWLFVCCISSRTRHFSGKTRNLRQHAWHFSGIVEHMQAGGWWLMWHDSPWFRLSPLAAILMYPPAIPESENRISYLDPRDMNLHEEFCCLGW